MENPKQERAPPLGIPDVHMVVSQIPLSGVLDIPRITM